MEVTTLAAEGVLQVEEAEEGMGVATVLIPTLRMRQQESTEEEVAVPLLEVIKQELLAEQVTWMCNF